jgi:hypothetical protein
MVNGKFPPIPNLHAVALNRVGGGMLRAFFGSNEHGENNHHGLVTLFSRRVPLVPFGRRVVGLRFRSGSGGGTV